MKIELKQLPWPEFTVDEDLPTVPREEYERRMTALYAAAGVDWVAVYADREHYANLTYLINFDPRFEEALLMLGNDGKRILIVGNEGMGYLSVLGAEAEIELCQSFSLNAQPRETAPNLKVVLAKIGVRAGQSIALAGWKYLESSETDDVTRPAFVPALVADVFRALTGPGGKVVDGTALLMHPENGLRSLNSADQIAAFEWAARSCSAAVFSILTGTRPGMSEMEAMSLMDYRGQPLTMHPIVASGKGEVNGLRSPSAKEIEYGDAITTGIGYWGSLVCRAGMMLGEPDESFMKSLAAPYFKAIATWYQTMRLDITGGEVFEVIRQTFAGSGIRSSLNPGHLTSFDEWVHSPIRPASPERIRSGMVFQSDIIPTPLPAGRLINCEDTVAIADKSLRAELSAKHPELWERVKYRRAFMAEYLGIHLAEELLPLTDGTAFLPPFWLAPGLVCAVVD